MEINALVVTPLPKKMGVKMFHHNFCIFEGQCGGSLKSVPILWLKMIDMGQLPLPLLYSSLGTSHIFTSLEEGEKIHLARFATFSFLNGMH